MPLQQRIEGFAADPSRGPELQSVLTAEAQSLAEDPGSDEFAAGVPFSS